MEIDRASDLLPQTWWRWGLEFVSSWNAREAVQLMSTFVLVIITGTLLACAVDNTRKWLLQRNNKVGKDKSSCRGLEALPQVRPLFPWKLIGNVPLLLPMSKILANIQKISTEYGDILKFDALNKTFVVLNSAPLAQTLMKSTDMGHGIKEPTVYGMFKPFIKNGVLVSSGKFWEGQRKILMRTQSFSSLKAFVEMLNRHSNGFLEDLGELFQDGAPHPINDQITTVFLKIINEIVTGFEMKSGSSEFRDYHHNFQIWKETIVRRLLNPLMFFDTIWNLLPMSKKYEGAVDGMNEFAKRRIKEHRDRRRGDLGQEDSTRFKSVLDELIDAGVDDDQIVDEVNTVLFAGHETGASTMHHFCFMMALHPEIQRECQKEIDELFNNNTPSSDNQKDYLTYESVQGGLKHLERCLLETLRLYPPAFILLRKLDKPLDIEHSGKVVRLPRGTSAVVIPYAIHRKEEYYPEAEKFNPDRFLAEEQAKRHPYSFLSFSAGPRNCLGMKFAMLELKIVGAFLLRNFEMETTDKREDVCFLPFTTLTPEKDFTFKFTRRDF